MDRDSSSSIVNSQKDYKLITTELETLSSYRFLGKIVTVQ